MVMGEEEEEVTMEVGEVIIMGEDIITMEDTIIMEEVIAIMEDTIVLPTLCTS